MARHLCDFLPQPRLSSKPVISGRMQESHSRQGALHRTAETTAATSYLLQEVALAALAQSTWAGDATSTPKVPRQAGAYQGIWGFM